MSKREYSDAQRAEALAVLEANRGNLRKSSWDTGIPLSTLATWVEATRGEDRDDGRVTVEKMRKVIGQAPGSDRGPTERRMREWLRKDVKGFLAKVEELERAERKERTAVEALAVVMEENACLKAEVERLREKRATGRDEGSERARALIDRILAECQE